MAYKTVNGKLVRQPRVVKPAKEPSYYVARVPTVEELVQATMKLYNLQEHEVENYVNSLDLEDYAEHMLRINLDIGVLIDTSVAH